MNISFHTLVLRLKSTSLAEIIYRICHVADMLRLWYYAKKGYLPFSVPVINKDCYRKLKVPTLYSDLNPLDMRKILAGRIFSLNEDSDKIKKYEDVFRDNFFNDVPLFWGGSDIRTIWEPARLQHITTLLVPIFNHDDIEYGKEIRTFVRRELLRWIKDNPFPYGPHYISAMECGLRIPVFYYSLKIDGISNSLFLETIYIHAWWISHHLSLHSSLGNHTVCEAVGLVFAGKIFHETPAGKSWFDQGITLLNKEITHQILNDGGPAEQSFSYHRFVLDLYWLVLDFIEVNQLLNCEVIRNRLTKGELFLNSMQNSSGNMPRIGDGDDGYAIAPTVYPKKMAMPHHNNRSITYADSGYTVIVLNNDDIKIVFDHGPLGMAPLNGHGHADALSVIVSHNGEWLLVDPGTYRYLEEPLYRKYFKSTRAHNTVTIDGLDQADQETGFIWSHPYKCWLIKNEQVYETRTVEAEHDGYDRLRSPVRHKRIVHACDSKIVIKDTFYGRGFHHYELNYHLHPACNVESDGLWQKVSGEKGMLYIRILAAGRFNIFNGQENPPFGWYSPAYNVKLRSTVLSCHQQGTPDDTTFITALCTRKAVSDNDLYAIVERL